MAEQQQHNRQPGTLYVVATPIGNLDDITLRALAVLKEVDCILAEDTRHSQRLLGHYGITTPTQAVHEHNEHEQVAKRIKQLEAGDALALISDAGTPLISDPGYRLVHAAHEAGLTVIPVPGACAAIAALSVSGLPTDHFVFEGFLPPKGAVREKRLRILEKETRSIVFYESVHRIVNLLELLCEVFGEDRFVTIARELTKTFETIHYDTLGRARQWLLEDKDQQKGEFVIVVKGHPKPSRDEGVGAHRELMIVLLSELSVKQAVSLATQITGAPHKALYTLALELSQG